MELASYVCTKKMVILIIFLTLLLMSLMVLRMNREDRFDSLFQYVCEDYSIDWKLVKAVAITESSLNPMAVSSCGAKGLMQLMDPTARDMKVIQVFDPEENIRGGVKYLDWLWMYFYGKDPIKNKMEFILASYNGGFGYIREATHLAINENKDPESWDEVKGMLWRKDCVVSGKRPKAGQIVAYVDKVMKKYEELKGGE